MRNKLTSVIKFILALFFCQNVCAQEAITNINTNNYNIVTSDSILNRKGAGVHSTSGLSGRWDSTGTNYKLVFNAGATDIKSVATINVSSITGIGVIVPLAAIATIKRLANAFVPHKEQHFAFWTATDAAPNATESDGTFLLNAPEITSMESALVSNNLNTGFDNIFQNTNENVHYGNVERIDYTIPSGFTISSGLDLNKIGFTIYARGDGSSFKIAGIKNLTVFNEPSEYIVPLLSVSASHFGNDLLASNTEFVTFQKDGQFNDCESRPSEKINQNIKGVFISLSSLGYIAGETVYGFSLFADDIFVMGSSSYLLDHTEFPTNTSSASMLDLACGISLINFNQVILSSPTVLKASLQNKNILLKWNAETNSTVDKIFLQKAQSDMQFRDLTELSKTQSSFIDDSQNNTDFTYYRLKMIKQNGSFEFSNIQFINFKEKETSIFPTIATSILNVRSSAFSTNKPLSIKIYNLLGKLISSASASANSLFKIDISYLSEGMYLIAIAQNNEVIFTKQFLKK
jgi:hypothetical protein